MRILRSHTTHQAARQAGFTLAESAVATGLIVLILLAMVAAACLLNNSFSLLRDRSDIQTDYRVAALAFTRDVREAAGVASFSTNTLVLTNALNESTTYSYDPTQQTWIRSFAGVDSTLLKGCTALQFALLQKPDTNSTYGVYSNATIDSCRVIEVNWSCTRRTGYMGASEKPFHCARVELRNR